MPVGSMTNIYGYKVIENESLTDKGPICFKRPEAQRKRRRLQARPKQYVKSHRTIPSSQVYVDHNNNAIYCHPFIADKIRRHARYDGLSLRSGMMFGSVLRRPGSLIGLGSHA